MKKYFLATIGLTVALMFIFTSCSQYAGDYDDDDVITATAYHEDSNDDDSVSYEIVDNVSDDNESYNDPIDDVNDSYSDTVSDVNDYDAALDMASTPLSERIFVGEGEVINTGGDEMEWFYHPFSGIFINSICCHYMRAVGEDVFVEWTHQFEGHSNHGWRNRREANFRTFVYDFGITKEEIIRVEEEMRGLPMEEIDALGTWARGLDIASIECDDEAWDVAIWAGMRSLREIEAIFTDDINFLWETFPGFGVLQNGNVYSPEWILSNIDRAITEEQIPIHEIERILESASYHSHLDEIRLTAESAVQAVR